MSQCDCGGAVAAGWLYVHKVNEQRELDGKYTSVRKELEVTEATLAEYRRYIDFVGEGRKFIMAAQLAPPLHIPFSGGSIICFGMTGDPSPSQGPGSAQLPVQRVSGPA